jgi:hypothetical protein
MTEDCFTIDCGRGFAGRDGEESGDAEQSRGNNPWATFLEWSDDSHDQFFAHRNWRTGGAGAADAASVCEFQ